MRSKNVKCWELDDDPTAAADSGYHAAADDVTDDVGDVTC